MAEWKDCTIADIGQVVGGATPSTKKPENYQGGTIPWITPKDLANFSGRYIAHGERNITEIGLKSCSTQLIPRHSILFSSRAPIGYVAIADNDLCTNQGFKSVVPNDNTDYMFLYYLLVYKRDEIENMGSGTTFKEVSGSTMRSIRVRVPKSLHEQRKIAGVLSALDDKIELNNKINKNLEEQAQAIFKSWFIDFEPFGGSKPDNWLSGTLGQIAEIKTNSFSPSKNPDILIEHYSIPAYDEKHFPVFEIASGIKSNKYTITASSVMISKLNPTTKRIWRPMCLSDNPVCSTEFIVYEPVKTEYRDYVYSIIDNSMFSDFLCAHTTGSTNSRQRVTPNVTLSYPVSVPPDEIIRSFCSIVTPMYDLISLNTYENQKLEISRDTLLPKIMSGELDVSDIDL